MKKKTAAERWRELPAKERVRALRLIYQEQTMWRIKCFNWHPWSIPEVEANHRSLGAAIAVLREAGRVRK